MVTKCNAIFASTDFRTRHADACSQIFLESVVSWLVPLIFTIVCVVGFVGNLLVIVVVIFYQQMRNTTNILILVSIRSPDNVLLTLNSISTI